VSRGHRARDRRRRWSEGDGWCNHLYAELSEDEVDPDWEADELVEWRVLFIGARRAPASAALSYAVEQHDGQTRKGTTIPYISHVLAVTASAMEMKPDAPAEAIGALLHDVVEDLGRMQRAREIAQRFGFDVPRIVLANNARLRSGRTAQSARSVDETPRATSP
jgi:(p)ppGpp synthase/HD superfamily hydrolase